MAEVEGKQETPVSSMPAKKQSKAKRGLRIFGVVLLLLILTLLLINAVLVKFKDDYYTTFGKYRLFAIVTDSMEPEIPRGSMIVDTKPNSADEIKVGTPGKADGTIITFRVKNNDGQIILLTHRVVGTTIEGDHTVYITKGDNAGGNDSFRPKFDDIVGIYTGNKCGFFGSLFGFLQSTQGIITLIVIMFIVVIAWIVIWFVNRTEIRRKIENAALKKSESALMNVNLRYDNINEITAVMDVLSMVTDDTLNRAERKEVGERLIEFINAENIELPHGPETAAILDSLPAPDTPSTLAAALSAGATLRQAEDGQTLVLTTLSGDKNILLTPVQTADGIILCQQGTRMRSDIAPNIEDVGITSMPASPEFFEGRPLQKNIIYPELPQPKKFDTGMLSPHGSMPTPTVGAMSRPVGIAAGQDDAPIPLGNSAADQRAFSSPGVQAMREKAEEVAEPYDELDTKPSVRENAARRAYAQYREAAAQLELRQAEQLRELLDTTQPMSDEDKVRVAEYKAAHKKPKKPSKPRTPEQRAAAKAAAEKRKVAQEAFLSALSPADRELYETEQKLSKARAATIRRLKNLEKDHKLLQTLNNNE